MEWLLKKFFKLLNIPNLSIFSFSINLNMKEAEHLSMKYKHYQEFKEQEQILLTFPECNAAYNYGGYGNVKACG